MIEMGYPMTPDDALWWQTFWTAFAAMATTFAAVVALLIGLEPRRLVKEQNEARAKTLGMAIAGEIELSAARVLAIVEALSPFDGDSVINDEKLKLIFHYLRSTGFPFLSRVATELHVFQKPLAGQLSLVYANQQRMALLASADGDIENYDLGDVLVSDLLPDTKKFYQSMIICLGSLRRLNDESFDEGPIKAAAQFFTETINVKHKS